MSFSTSSSPPSSPSSPLTLEGFQLLTVQTMSAPAHGPSKGPDDKGGGTRGGTNPARSHSQDSQGSVGSQGPRIAGRASVTLLRMSDIKLSNRASWESPTFMSSPPSAYDSTPDNSPPRNSQHQTQTSQGTYTRNRSIARASRPPALPLATSSHVGLGAASGSPPESLFMRAPTPPQSRRRRTLDVPSDALKRPGASGAAGAAGFKAAAGGAADSATPKAPEPTSAHSHQSFATFGGGREPDSPRTKDPPLPAPPSVPHLTPSPRARHQSLDSPQAPFPLPPRMSSISHSGVPNPRKVFVPARTSSLVTPGSGGASASYTPHASSYAQVSGRHQVYLAGEPQRSRDSDDVPVPSSWANRRQRASDIYEHPGGSKSCVELVRADKAHLGHQLEPADDHDALTDSPSLDTDFVSESGLSIAPLLPRASADSQASQARASSDCGHAQPILLPNPQNVSGPRAPPRAKPRVRISHSVDSYASLSTSTMEHQQKALLIRRNRKLGQMLGVSLPEADVGQYVVEPSMASTTVLTRVDDAWPDLRGPEWSRDDCLPQLAEHPESPEAQSDGKPRRTKSKLRRPIEGVRAPADLQVYVSRETSVTETVAPASHQTGDSAASTPPSTPFQTREEAVRARRRAQLAKLQRILGSPISPRLVLAPEDDVPTCGVVRTPSETSLSSPRRASVLLRERVKSFVIPSPIYAMSETERRLARKRASKLEHLFGDAPPTEMIFPGRPEAPHALNRIHEADGGTVGLPGLDGKIDGFEGRMFISTSPAAAAHHTPEETFEGYRHSLLGIMHLIETDQGRLGAIIDQLEPQLYNLHVQSSLALHMRQHGPNARGAVTNTPPGRGLARRSSAPPRPNFARHPDSNSARNGEANGAASTNGTIGNASGHGHTPSGSVHFRPNGARGQGHTPHASVSSAQRADADTRPSMQSQRSVSGDPFSEYLRSQGGLRPEDVHVRQGSTATNSTVRAGGSSATASASGHVAASVPGHGSGDPPRAAGAPRGGASPYGPGGSPRKLSGFFGKPKTPTAPRHPLSNDAKNGSALNLAQPVASALNLPRPAHDDGREDTAAVPENAMAPGSGAARKRGRKFSKLFSGGGGKREPQPQPQVLRPNPFYVRRQTLDGVLAELRRSFLLDLENGRLRPADAHALHDMLELLNSLRANSPWAELEDSEW